MKIRPLSEWQEGDRAVMVKDDWGFSCGDVHTLHNQHEADRFRVLGHLAARALTPREVQHLPVGAEVVTMRIWRGQPRGTVLYITDGRGNFEPRRHGGGHDAACSELLALIALPRFSAAEIALQAAEGKLNDAQENLRFVREEVAEARRQINAEKRR